ncbi:MAG: HAMP domain-containing histidine kinase [Clostridia bacterium]|nr:HAMP domain-containing histidine kinase [Clostridia bacterium]
MRKKGKIKSFLMGTIFPFFTVILLVSVSLIVYEQIKMTAGDKPFVVSLVMLLTVCALSVLFVVGDKIRRKITNEAPVKEILDATEKIASGDFSVRFTTIHSYENYNDYDLIKENLNAMVAELEKSEILKTDFISNVSHEIKTPLSIIQNYISLVQEEKDEEKRKKYIETVILATKRLSSLITNVLKLNKLEHQELNVEYQKIRLDQMLAEAILSFEDLIDKKQIEIDCSLEEIEINSSASCLEIVWNNLISNAIKFTEPNGKITIKLYRKMDEIVVEVADTGCGISADTGAKIFDKFYQGDTSHSGEGNGLGLALVKKVIDLIGGKISVESQLGKGSKFTIVLKDTGYEN